MTVPTKPQIRAGNLWNTYMSAWRHGAGARAMDPKFTEHTNAEIRAAYARGYQVGRDAANIVAASCAAIYGYEPSVMRLAENDIRCGVEGCRLPPDHGGLHKFGGNIP